MLMTKSTARKFMCPLSAGRAKPFGCRGPSCAAWTLWTGGTQRGSEARRINAETLHFCGQIQKPDLAQFDIQFGSDDGEVI